MRRLLLLLLAATALAQPQKTRVVFAVQGRSLDPVALVENGKLVSPFDSTSPHEMALKALVFLDERCARGTTYHLSGGGTATIQDSSAARKMAEAGSGAWYMTCPATFKGPARGLALSTPTPKRPERPPTKEEKARLPQGLTGVLVRDLDHDGSPELLGTTKEMFVMLSLGKPVIQENGHYTLLDTVNLVGDATDELVLRSEAYEHYEYVIYQRQAGGAWTAVYHGGGGGS